ncbi:MAG: L,D-transpeptidase family protein [Rhodospirillaceae bacterium]|nr:L,D-transpeptidase family protein [Rhodospirillaceae bacterium]
MMERLFGSCTVLGLMVGLAAPSLANETTQIEAVDPATEHEDVIAAPVDVDAIGEHAPSLSDPLIARWIDQLQAELNRVEAELEQPRTTVPLGGTMREGDFGPRVELLARRLAELGYIGEGDVGPVFDAALSAAIERFQDDAGLFVDGLVGPQTLAELNRSLEETRVSLLWTIDQMQHLRSEAYDDMMLVNVPSTRSLLIEDGHVVMDITTAVGRYTRQTPLLDNDRIVNVTLNPRWSVPSTIMREDVLPLLRAEGRTGVYDAQVFLGGEEVDPAEVDWSEIQPWQIYIRQSPGDHSALGRYLFSLTNDQNIFIHDTNHHAVFQRANRWISSGCIRVESARDLALYLIRRAGYSDEELDRRLASGVTQVMPLPEEYQVPVFVTYFTAVPDGDRITYHRDIYDRTAGFQPMPPLASGGPALRGDGS